MRFGRHFSLAEKGDVKPHVQLLASQLGFGTLRNVTYPVSAGGDASSKRGFAFVQLLSIFLALVSTRSWAQGASEPRTARAAPQVRVDCPELDDEQRAAVEARQMSELLSQGVDDGTLLLVCSPDRVSGIWQEGGVTVDSRFLSRNQGESAVELLHWLASVLLELRRQRETPTPAPPGVEAGAVIATTSEPGLSSESTISPAPEPVAPVPVKPEQPVEPRAAVEPGSPRTEPYFASPWTLAVGVNYAHFGTEIPGALGPRIGIDRLLLPRFRVLLAFDGKVGLESTDVGMLDAGAMLGVSYDILPFLSLQVGPRLVVTTFILPTETTGSNAPVVTAGFFALARGRVPLEVVRPFIDVGIEATTPTLQVTIAGNPVLTVPAWQASLTAGIELAL